MNYSIYKAKKRMADLLNPDKAFPLELKCSDCGKSFFIAVSKQFSREEVEDMKKQYHCCQDCLTKWHQRSEV